MSDGARRLILSIGGVACVAIVLFAYFVLLGDDSPPPAPVAEEKPVASAQEVGEDFAAAWARADHAAAAALTDRPDVARAALTSARQAVGPRTLSVVLSGPVAESGESARATAEVGWTLDDDRTLSYTTEFGLARRDGQWKVRWAPGVVHPKLADGTRLALRVAPEVAVVDRDGRPLVRGGASVPSAGRVLGPAMVRAAGGESAGSPAVVIVDGAGKEKAELLAGDSAKPITSTVDIEAQAAAQAAVDAVKAPAYLVAIDASDGGILAVAQNSAATGTNALNGLYPPGSTFKIVTASAVLSAGAADAGTVLPCPGEATIGTRRIRNDGFELGAVPLTTAFARSCNTTFAALAADLPGDSLSAAAARFGLAADFEIPGITTQTGGVDPANGTPQQVENAIGQGTVQASPFGLALMAATVARGDAVTPRLYDELETQVNRGYEAPAPGTVAALRTMMRAVVTSGTGSALGRYGAVAGKTGTAQFGDGRVAHGWFAGYRGDVAFAVLVEGAGTSGPAVTAVGRFLGGL
ncbi:penicillin-binding transpeptidase domain-containing protein [Actinokineospora fastidiosa]|uniref:Penicillin-binding protein n=1 Tax=Actinokineospora fastidiosa TaxID=1816 RepID=A0A918GIJ1_9PSEU|nr:penicillin-binding transpeptidase domain-containing protein [Actinokineospora fastidiosa]GGS38271.1 penicillin-binding protein [Actinokineospora fastidiosa]